MKRRQMRNQLVMLLSIGGMALSGRAGAQTLTPIAWTANDGLGLARGKRGATPLDRRRS